MWIECGIINYKLIIPLIYPLLYQVKRIIHKNEEKPFLEFFTNYLGYLLSGLVYLFIKFRMKKKVASSNDDTDSNDDDIDTIILPLNDLSVPNDTVNFEPKPSFIKVKTHARKNTLMSENINGNNQIALEKEKIKKMNSRKKHLYILILVIIYLIPMLLDAYNPYTFKTSSSVSLFFCIISYVIFGKLILGMKIYSHQIFSLIVILLANVVIVLLAFIGKHTQNFFLSLVFIVSIVVLYCLYNNLAKRYFNVYMGSPYYLMFIIGLISICLIFAYEIITVIAFGKDTNFNGIFFQMEKNFEKTKLYPLIFFGDIISAFLWIAGIILTVYFFSPCHFIICESISQILSAFINQNLEELSVARQVIIYILFFVIFLGSLIYNEIFIINIGSLSKNTQKHIIIRQKEETNNIIIDSSGV